MKVEKIDTSSDKFAYLFIRCIGVDGDTENLPRVVPVGIDIDDDIIEEGLRGKERISRSAKQDQTDRQTDRLPADRENVKREFKRSIITSPLDEISDLIRS